MAIEYTIERRGFYDGQNYTVARKMRRDAAARAAYSAVYGMLRDNALLDRPVANRLADEVNGADFRAPRVGREIEWRFRLGDIENQSVRVIARHI